MNVNFQIQAFLLFDVIRHTLVHFLQLLIDLSELLIDLSLPNVSKMQLGYIVGSHLSPTIIAVHDNGLGTELPDGLIRQNVAIASHGNSAARMRQSIFQILNNLQLMTAKCKGKLPHPVVAQNHATVRVSKADTHRKLVSGLFNREGRQLIFAAAVFSRKCNGKVQCRKDDNDHKKQPCCMDQKCILARIGISLGHRKEQCD